MFLLFFFSSRRRHTRCALVTGVQTCALPLASRARTHVRAARPRFTLPRERGLEIAAAFFAASRSGDMETLRSMLAADVAVHSDGGGKVPAAMKPTKGIADVMKLQAGLARDFAGTMYRNEPYGPVNG